LRLVGVKHSHAQLLLLPLLLLLLLQALNMYREVLKQQPDNIYAVNGLGTCLAELGHMAAAKQAFDEVGVREFAAVDYAITMQCGDRCHACSMCVSTSVSIFLGHTGTLLL
jgi:tetratricopeptide (TPR) repeat protein